MASFPRSPLARAVGLLLTLCGLLLARPVECRWWTFNLGASLTGDNYLVIATFEDRDGNIWFGAHDGGVTRYDGLEWKRYTPADGLADKDVTCIAQGSDGALWFGTEHSGVSRYDGTTWRTYTTADGLVSNIVNSVIVDRRGNVWLATKLGISRFDGSRWTTFQPGLWITDAYEDRDGILWFGSHGGGLYRYDGTSWTIFTTENTVGGLAANSILGIVQGDDGALWVGCNATNPFGRTVCRLFEGSWTAHPEAMSVPYATIVSILKDKEGTIWFASSGGGVSSYDGQRWRYYTTADGLADPVVLSILEDRAGALWFGMHQGAVSRFDKGGWSAYAPPGWGEDVYSGVMDRDGNLWFNFTKHGIARYDGVAWTTYSKTNGLEDYRYGEPPFNYLFYSALADRSGNIWFGGNDLIRFDGTQWTAFTSADGLAYDVVSALAEDGTGAIWAGTWAGLSRFDGSTWTTYTRESTSGGLAGDFISDIVVAPDGALWIACGSDGLNRFDGTTWTTYTTADGLPAGYSNSLFVDRQGALYFQTETGLARFDGSSWTAYPSAEALAEALGTGRFVDRDGGVWLGAGDGMRRFDGETWTKFTSTEGLRGSFPYPLFQDRGGSIWFRSNSLAWRFDPDRAAPSTRFLLSPSTVSGARSQAASSTAAFEDVVGITYSFRLDGDSWTGWSPYGTWSRGDLADGAHVLAARSRDHEGNIDAYPALASFEIDAMPPRPIIATPAFGQSVRGTIEIGGTASDARFSGYRLEVSRSGVSSGEPDPVTLLRQSSAQVVGGVLGTWDTSVLPDGLYDLSLSVTDSLGLTGVTQITLIVDNQFPSADQTSPARVVAATGGDIYTTNAEAHLYFSPRAFPEDALVTVTPNSEDAVPDTLPSGATRILAGYDLAWGPSGLGKPARFELSLPGAPALVGTPAIYLSTDGQNWRRLGGTVEASTPRIALVITEPGRYALFVDSGADVGGAATLSGIAFTPRVFSPTGTFADREVSIGFTLGRSSPVTVRVYNRAGRLVREIVAAKSFAAGANLVRWDGADRHGSTVVDGLYIVTVEALSHTERRTLAVVR